MQRLGGHFETPIATGDLFVLVQPPSLHCDSATYEKVWRNLPVRLVDDFADLKAGEEVVNRPLGFVHVFGNIGLTLSGLNSVAAVTQRSRTGLRRQTPSAPRQIRLLRSCPDHDGPRPPIGIHRPRI